MCARVTGLNCALKQELDCDRGSEIRANNRCKRPTVEELRIYLQKRGLRRNPPLPPHHRELTDSSLTSPSLWHLEPKD